MTVEQLLARIERFMKKHHIADTRFGRDAVRDPALVSDLRNGRAPTMRLVARVVKFMEARGG